MNGSSISREWKIGIGVLLAILAAATQFRSLWRDLRPGPKQPVDFFQDWASARLYFDGEPVYGDQAKAMDRYLGLKVRRAPGQPFIEVNAHPPPSVTLMLPFGKLSYPNAAFLWNLLSLGALAWSIRIVVKELQIPFQPWMSLYVIPALLLCGPLREQIGNAQMNLLLLLLLVGTWAAARHDRSVLAGALWGTLIAIKLFPGMLLLYFLMRRRWRIIIVATLCTCAWIGLSLLVLGWDNLQGYVRDALPGSKQFYEFIMNQSLLGYWHKLFAGESSYVVPLLSSPVLAKALTVVSSLAVMALVTLAARRASSPQAQDHAFGLAIVGMMLVSPLVWSHYYVMLLLPGMLLGRDAPAGWERTLFFAAIVCLWIGLLRWWGPTLHLTAKNWWHFTARPHHVLTIVSVHFYAVLALFGLEWRAVQSHCNEGRRQSGSM